MATTQPLQHISNPSRNFGRYELLFHLAQGGMARLDVARIRGLRGFAKLVVIKCIHDEYADDPQFVDMLVDEARIAARISHPNVVQVLELGRLGDRYYIAMEYVDGENLETLSRATPLSPVLCARIIADAAAGLHAAHELVGEGGEPLNVVHRDVSPSNILLSYDGNVRVADFGVARARDNVNVTKVGTIKGKHSYLAPEYAMGSDADRRSDVFSLGIVLYEITTRTRLFKAVNSSETLHRVVNADVAPPSTLVNGYPPELERIVMKALRRDPQRRYQSAVELQRALERYMLQAGRPVLSTQLAAVMQRTFAERAQRKQEMIQAAEASAADDYDDVDFVVTVARVEEQTATRLGYIRGAGKAATKEPPAKPPTKTELTVYVPLPASYYSFVEESSTERSHGTAPEATAAAETRIQSHAATSAAPAALGPSEVCDESVADALSLTPGPQPIPPRAPRLSPHHLIMLVAGALFACSLMAHIVYFMLPEPFTVGDAVEHRHTKGVDYAQAQSGTRTAVRVRLQISSPHHGATIRVDGKPVANPFADDLERSSGLVRVTVAAPGYISQNLALPRDRSRVLEVRLNRATRQRGAGGSAGTSAAAAHEQDAETDPERSAAVPLRIREASQPPTPRRERAARPKGLFANPFR